MSSDDRTCRVRWTPSGTRRYPDSLEPLRDGHVSRALYADFVRSCSLEQQHLMCNRLLLRVPNTPCVGQHGVVARRDLARGSFIPFPTDTYLTVAAPYERAHDIERNAFRHPSDITLAIDAVPGELLQSINSGWNGRRMARTANARLHMAGGVLFAVVTRSVREGTEVLFGYRF